MFRLCSTNSSWLQGLWKKADSQDSFQILQARRGTPAIASHVCGRLRSRLHCHPAIQPPSAIAGNQAAGLGVDAPTVHGLEELPACLLDSCRFFNSASRNTTVTPGSARRAATLSARAVCSTQNE